MPQQDTSRLEHDLTKTLGRDQPAEQIINDLWEMLLARGFEETTRNGQNQITSTIVWETSGKTKKRADMTVTRAIPPFVSQIVTQIYNEEGTAVVASLTETITRDGNNIVTSVESVISRP